MKADLSGVDAQGDAVKHAGGWPGGVAEADVLQLQAAIESGRPQAASLRHLGHPLYQFYHLVCSSQRSRDCREHIPQRLIRHHQRPL